MPDRCTNPSCEQHWPAREDAPEVPDLLGRLQASLEKARANRKSSIVDDITRAMRTVAAAPAYKHDCQAQGCPDE